MKPVISEEIRRPFLRTVSPLSFPETPFPGLPFDFSVFWIILIRIEIIAICSCRSADFYQTGQETGR